MPEQVACVESVRWRRLFPWLHLFRTFWIAVDLRKLLLAAAGLLLIAVGDAAINASWFGERESFTRGAANVWPWNESLGYETRPGEGAGAFVEEALRNPWHTLGVSASNWQLVLRPLNALLRPVVRLLHPQTSWPERAYFATRFLWGLAVWALLGGAITRIAAVQIARDMQVSLWNALAFSATRFLEYFSAPLLPLAAVVALGSISALGGLLAWIPVAGEILLGILWGVGLILALLMTLMLVGLAAGWPLMFATISVEASDGFDGLSRAYNYVFERPLLFVWSALLAVCYGSVAIFFVWFMGEAAVQLSGWGVAWSLGADGSDALLSKAPELVRGAVGDSDLPASLTRYATGSRIVHVWTCGVALLVVSFVHSYFWTAVTMLYYVLRQSADGNDFDEVHLDDAAHEIDHLLPLVGTAAMTADQPPVPPSSPPMDLTP